LHTLTTNGPLRLIQITDTHLLGPEDGRLLGMPTSQSLDCVLNSIRKQHPQFDAFLVTGDLTQDGSEKSYQHLHDVMSTFQRPAFWLRGNHDEPSAMSKVAQGTEHLQRVIRNEHWQIIMLNSQVEGAVFGELAGEELEFLDYTLTEAPDLHTLVCLHHHPVSMNCAWIDPIGLRNSHEFMQLLSRHDNVRGVAWGHVHQALEGVQDGIRLMATPSTCIQFEPNSDDFALDDQNPGYRWFELHADGKFDTGVERVKGVHFEVDHSQTGY